MQRTNNSPDGTTSASEYDVKSIRIFTKASDDPIDITKMVNYIEIYESIFSPFLTVNVNITDTLSLTHALPMIGEEIIELDVRGPDGETGIIQQGFYIYKISDRMTVADKAVVYTMNCISPAAIIDMNIKLSQAISGQPSDIIKDKLCKSALSIAKEVYSQPTKNNISYISNYWSPLQNIRYISDRSVSKDGSAASYLFFETKRQFNFVPLNTLVAQDSTFSYFYIANTHTSDIVEQQQIIHKMYIDEQFDYIERITNGAYGNRTLVVDLTKKNYEYQYYDFMESFEKHSRLNDLPYGTESAARRINSIFRTKTNSSSSIPGMTDEMNNEWYRQRLTELAAINSQTLAIDVVGRFNLYAGNVIDIAVPITTLPQSANDEKLISKSLDRSLSGRYLVTSLKHMLTRERHTMHIHACKDSIPDIT